MLFWYCFSFQFSFFISQNTNLFGKLFPQLSLEFILKQPIFSRNEKQKTKTLAHCKKTLIIVFKFVGVESQVTSRKDQEQYWARKDEVYRFVTAEEFTEAFQSFNVGRNLGDELAVPFDKAKSPPSALATEKYGVDKELLKACASRQYLLMKRNSILYLFNMVKVSSISNPFIFLEMFLKIWHNIKGHFVENR